MTSTTTLPRWPGVAALFSARPKMKKLRLYGVLDGPPHRAEVVLKRRGADRIAVTDGGGYGSDKFFGYINADGSHGAWSELPGLTAALDRLNAEGFGYVAENGKKAGQCGFCGLELTDPESVERGYGPICARNHGLPHGNRHGF